MKAKTVLTGLGLAGIIVFALADAAYAQAPAKVPQEAPETLVNSIWIAERYDDQTQDRMRWTFTFKSETDFNLTFLWLSDGKQMVSKSDTGIYSYSAPTITFTQGSFTGTLEIKDGVILLQNPNTGDMFVFFKQNMPLPEAGSTDRIHGMPELAGPKKPRIHPEQQ